MWLFDGALDSLPGGFDVGELSPNSPVKVLKSFPQECVLVGRSTVRDSTSLTSGAAAAEPTATRAVELAATEEQKRISDREERK